MHDDYKLFLYLLAGVFSVFALTYLYGIVLDLRRGRTGLLMIVLACGIVIGLAYHFTLAIVSAILFSAAWIVDTRRRLEQAQPPTLAEAETEESMQRTG